MYVGKQQSKPKTVYKSKIAEMKYFSKVPFPSKHNQI